MFGGRVVFSLISHSKYQMIPHFYISKERRLIILQSQIPTAYLLQTGVRLSFLTNKGLFKTKLGKRHLELIIDQLGKYSE